MKVFREDMAIKVHIDEKDIIQRIIQGEKDLFKVIVRKYNPILYKIGRSYNYNHEDTQDLMQDSFIDAYKNLNQFKGNAQLMTWIIRIMMNNCYRKKEKSSFKYEVVKDINDQSVPLFSNPDVNTEKMAQNHELSHIIEKSLEKLPEKYRIVFSLREINFLNISETAEILQTTESNVKVMLNRAKAMLRLEIENNYSKCELYEFNLIYCDAMVEAVMKRINELEK
ncbi:MAG: sigma-70 family RNA polymerase sigma factor [Saprospiraceae bacterium]|jgi:RNA polymerase sigma factor (sigma-70 family)|nr:sigma-70 family RNA polymerase sigma factor [Saprospiraceae bacterium]HQU95805.1 sigma-70 family RNA polymerase sigma factor [Saprospiraceae bacterium]